MIKDTTDRTCWRPVPVEGPRLARFIRTRPGIQVADQYVAALEELFLLRHPTCRFKTDYQEAFAEFLSDHVANKPLAHAGRWFYFPWLNQLVHYLTEPLHLELKTGRNRNLITKDEQDRYYQARVAVMGLSVGSHVALTLAMTGGAKHLVLADPDTISGGNLNRIRAGVPAVGLSKVVSVARQTYEMNPYANVTVYPDGVTDENVLEILAGPPKADLLIEEMDNPYFKVKARMVARQQGIPVLMGADNGDNIIVDVERYDKHRRYPLCHGVLGDLTAEDLRAIPPRDLPRVVARFAGAELATSRMQRSLLEVGRTLYSWPQLGTAATMNGAVLAYLARKLLIGEPLASSRYPVNLDAIFEPDYHSARQRRTRARETRWFLKKLGLPLGEEPTAHG